MRAKFLITTLFFSAILLIGFKYAPKNQQEIESLSVLFNQSNPAELVGKWVVEDGKHCIKS